MAKIETQQQPLSLTDYTLPQHQIYAPNYKKGEALITIKVGDVEIPAPAEVICPSKFNPKLEPPAKYVRPGSDK